MDAYADKENHNWDNKLDVANLVKCEVENYMLKGKFVSTKQNVNFVYQKSNLLEFVGMCFGS